MKGALDVPVWCALDAPAYADVLQPRDDEQPAALAGVPRAEVPYLAWPSELLAAEAIGARPRKVRRNLMRRAHHAP